MVYYIYKITNPIGQIYVGCSKNLKDRWRKYRQLGCKDQPRIYESLIKYGSENHSFEVLEACSKENKETKEAYWGHLYNTFGDDGLNDSLPKIEGKSSFSERYLSKRVYTEEDRERFRIRQTGKKHKPETIQKLKEIKKGFKHTEETKRKISEKKIGVKISKEHRLRMGKKREKHHKAKILLNTQTGVFYECIKDAAESIPMNYSTFQNQMTGRCPKKINFIYTD